MAIVSITRATTVEAVQTLRPVWSRLTVPNIDADIDYFLTVLQALTPPAQPHVIHFRKVDGRDVLVVARIEEFPLAFKIGYFTIGRVKLKAIVVCFDGILGATGRCDEEVALVQLRKGLDAGDADLVVIRNLNVVGERIEIAQSAVPWFARGYGQRDSRRWVIELPNDYEAFLARRSSTTRKKLRWEGRALAKQYGDDLKLRRFERHEEFEELCSDMAAVGARSYQHKLGAAFTGSSFDKALLKLGLEEGWVRVWMLYLGDRPVAFWPGTVYGHTFGVGTPGFDPEYAKYAVGRFTMLKMIEDMCNDQSVSTLDFGQGEADYKSQFGHPAHLERDVLLSALRPWPLLVLWCHSLFVALNAVGNRLASSMGWVRRMKRYWRKREQVALVDVEAN